MQQETPSHTFTIAHHSRPVGELTVQIAEGPEDVDVPHLCQTAMAAVCEIEPKYGESEKPWALTVRFGGEEEGLALNRDFRHKDYATNVLSFVSDDDAPDMEEWYVGDIFVCTPVLEREAKAEGKPLGQHLQHLVIHGLLHLVGYDHELGDVEAERMENLERAIMAEMGLPDPYPVEVELENKERNEAAH